MKISTGGKKNLWPGENFYGQTKIPMSDEIERLKAQIKALEEQDYCENEFEELLMKNPEVVQNAFEDINNTKLEQVKATSVKDIEDILQHFNGTSLTRKKQTLVNFLKSFPIYKTSDVNLLRKRLKRLERTARERAQRGEENTEFWYRLRASGFIFEQLPNLLE